MSALCCRFIHLLLISIFSCGAVALSVKVLEDPVVGRVNQPAVLQVSYSGVQSEPFPQIVWSFNKQLLYKEVRRCLPVSRAGCEPLRFALPAYGNRTAVSLRGTSLRIARLRPEDAGQYTVRVTAVDREEVARVSLQVTDSGSEESTTWISPSRLKSTTIRALDVLQNRTLPYGSSLEIAIESNVLAEVQFNTPSLNSSTVVCSVEANAVVWGAGYEGRGSVQAGVFTLRRLTTGDVGTYRAVDSRRATLAVVHLSVDGTGRERMALINKVRLVLAVLIPCFYCCLLRGISHVAQG